MLKQLTVAMCAAGIMATGAATGYGQAPIVRIEEDWELNVQQPDQELDAPQIATTMVPFGADSDLLFQVDLNHASYPNFSKGGYQVRANIDSDCLASVRYFNDQRLSFDSEIVRWTQVVQQTQSGFAFGVKAGTSTTWGSFGGNHAFVLISYADAASNSLAQYSPAHSLENSGVTYASNRVAWLRLKRVRLFDSVGNVTEYVVNQDVQ